MSDKNNMYNPCVECFNRYGKQYTPECDSRCEFANVLSKLKPYGTIDEIVEILKGDRIPLTMLDKDHIDNVYKIVYMAKNGYI